MAALLLCGMLSGCSCNRRQLVGQPEPSPAAAEIPCPALTPDEVAALRWLDHITGPLPPAEEQEWWEIGGRQFGLSSLRYHIAFAGYAAAALGMRGTPEERRVIGRILDNCIQRILKREVWAYSQSKSYWGQKPWAPDPCYRENVMYTGHLLQLLALYERFTGDTKYWTHGFDFVWNNQSRIHYDVQKLIDATVEQMRESPSGGVTCEPGLLFFPCNNHPQIALKIFASLGHGDWTAEARRWEEWALKHYQNPLLGGGVLNLVCHTRSGLFYPRGYSGLDAWALLWYEPWAQDRSVAVELWQKAREKLDWEALADLDDVAGDNNCWNPQKVPETVLAAFLAAAARSCGDPDTAVRLEDALDAKYLRRQDGYYWLDLNREWRIGATAKRIIALALENGSSFRTFVGQ